jgi:DNA-binding ferritin-like protein
MIISDVVTRLLYLLMQVRIFHWQTTSFAQHEAFGKFYDSVNALLDEFVEAYQGRYERIMYNDSIVLKNMDEVDLDTTLDRVVDILVNEMELDDTDLLNIRDEILGAVNKLKYLLTLQ